MNDLQIFKNTEFGEIRTMTIDNEPWFVGKDVASVLGYTDTFGAIKKHVDEEDKQNCQNNSFETPRGMIIINESGLYSLILSSKLPKAKEFKRWVTSEVLPAIRKHGAYMTEQTLEQALTSPDFLIKLATELKTERAKRAELEAENADMKPHAILGKAITTANTSILIGDFAKILRQNGVNIGAKRLFQWLREHGYLIRRKGSDWNMPTQKSMELKLFEIKESVHIDGNGCNIISRTPKITGRGQSYFVNKFLEAN